MDPQFKGQVKHELISRNALKLVSSLIKDPLDIWLNQNIDVGRQIAEIANRQATIRLNKNKKRLKKEYLTSIYYQGS